MTELALHDIKVNTTVIRRLEFPPSKQGAQTYSDTYSYSITFLTSLLTFRFILLNTI